MSGLLRLNRFLALAGVASRRRCDELIRDGQVRVNGEVVSELGARVDASTDEVRFEGRRIELPTESRTLLLNKPRDVLVAAVDERGRRTVMDLLKTVGVRVFPVGRLDYRSEGLLLFTNDGDLAYRLAHPRFKVEKLYHVEVDGGVEPAVVEALREGVTLEDGVTQPARVEVLAPGGKRTLLEIELKEGRKRQIRRMLAVYGHRVTRLTRVRFGPLEMGDLPRGKWRDLSAREVQALKVAVGLSGSAEDVSK